MPNQAVRYWTHPSVIGIAGDQNPIDVIVEKARALSLSAIEAGWTGPPFDPFALAQHLKIPVVPRDDIKDARTVPIPHASRLQIEYNPNRPPARIRYSIAHEIAHTLFPDCREHVRNRAAKHQMVQDDWQLEMLCNIGAAELLMPVGSFPEIGLAAFSIDELMRLREQFHVSTEAVLLRFVKLSRIPCAVFAASRQSPQSDGLRVDYTLSANDWNVFHQNGFEIPVGTVVYDCSAIGYTAKGDETWDKKVGPIHVECIAVPSYPGADHPRIVGLLSPTQPHAVSFPNISYVVGDATEPRGDGPHIIAHVVNDATPRWGGGFALVVRNRWPSAQDDFVTCVTQDKTRLRLGNHRIVHVDDGLFVFSMVAQHGYGRSEKPRIRYRALESCLTELANIAKEQSATIHMPRIGCGQAGGSWAVVSELIDSVLCRNGIDVVIYDLPSERGKWLRTDAQQSLFDDAHA